jgi:DNA polymerase (family 10)
MSVTRERLVEVLEEIALLLEIQGENPFKVRAYRQGAEIVSGYDGDIVALAREEKLEGIKGIGEALRDKLHELATTGELEFHKNLRARYPDSFFELFDITGLGPKKIAALHKTLGVDSIAALKAACDAGKVAELPGFGDKTQVKILDAISRREQSAGVFRLDEASTAAEEILEILRFHPEVLRAAVAGSTRRSKELVHDLDFIVATPKPAELTGFFAGQPFAKEVIAHGDTKCSILLENGMQCDLRAVSNDQYPFALFYFTGSKEHNVAIRSRALKQGWSLNEYGFTGDNLPVVRDEADIYRALGLDFVPPELRENRGEIEAADEGTLPRLIEWENLRGTFHNHTTESDGRSTLDQMAEGARELGLQYLGISDHSKSSPQARGLDEERLAAQLESIAAWNREHGGPQFRLFSGSEVDILKDGSLDFDEDLLARLDFAVASVHNVLNLDDDAADHPRDGKPARHHARPPHRPHAAAPRRLCGESREDHRLCRGDPHRHRAELQPEALRHGLALVAPRPRQGRALLDQPRRPLRQPAPVPQVRRQRRAQGLAAAGRRDQHQAARRDRGMAEVAEGTAMIM